MLKIGLKLWSTNEKYVKPALALYHEGFCDYIELFAVPGSLKNFLPMWKALEVPYLIHAPHYYGGGMCLSQKDAFEKNMELAAETLKFADALKAPHIIFHSGVGGNIEETARQLSYINDPRILVENKPYRGIKGEICNGVSPKEIGFLMASAKVGFCLDIGHALCAANSLKRPHAEFLSEMSALEPTLFHLTDGYKDGEKDVHLHLGTGSFDFDLIRMLLPQTAQVSIECYHDSEDHLDDFKDDSKFLRQLFKYSPSDTHKGLSL